MRPLALAAIRLYQRHLSPHKGFCCAYRRHTGRQGCSELGFRAIRRYGVLAGWALLRRRLYLCGVAHRRFSPAPRRPFRAQRGDCDIGCDLPCDGFELCGDAADCCDWPERNKRSAEEDKDVHLPPDNGRGRARE